MNRPTLETANRRRGTWDRTGSWLMRPWKCPTCKVTMKMGGKGPHGVVCGKPDTALWSKVDKRGPNGCWLYLGARDKWGYGDLCRRSKHIQAHRYVWKLLVGDPGDMDVLHKCNNPPCCNPAHLYLGTDKENAADRVRAGRHVRGEKAYNALMTESQVRKLRAERERTGKSYYKLGAEFGISYTQARGICVGKYWKHVA